MRAFDTNRRNTLLRRPLAWYGNDLDPIFNDMEQWLEPTYRNEERWNKVPACDVTEDDEAFLMCVELPGVKKDDIEIGIDDGRLTITAEKINQFNEEKGKVRRLERHFGRFTRQFTLPEGLEVEKIQADYQDGVLHVHLPKVEKTKPKTIKIGEGRGVLKRLIKNHQLKENTKAANE